MGWDPLLLLCMQVCVVPLAMSDRWKIVKGERTTSNSNHFKYIQERKDMHNTTELEPLTPKSLTMGSHTKMGIMIHLC